MLKCFKLNRDFKRNQHLSSHFVLTLDFSSCGDPITLTVTLAIGWNIFWMGGKIELPSYAVNSLSIPSLSCFTEGSRLSGDYVEDGNFICLFFVEDSTEHSVILRCCVGSVQADELPKCFGQLPRKWHDLFLLFQTDDRQWKEGKEKALTDGHDKSFPSADFASFVWRSKYLRDAVATDMGGATFVIGAGGLSIGKLDDLWQ